MTNLAKEFGAEIFVAYNRRHYSSIIELRRLIEEDGGQDCHTGVSGAHTGDVSAQMLADVGAAYVIVGHSERRADHGETDAVVREKALAARAAGLTPIICVGETLDEREAGETLAVIGRQVEASVPDAATDGGAVIAYEPVWAIGTGKVASPEQVAEVHQAIRDMLSARFGAAGTGMRILYGGSMKAENAAEILGIANVDGGLIGGASLQADSFLAIYEAALRA